MIIRSLPKSAVTPFLFFGIFRMYFSMGSRLRCKIPVHSFSIAGPFLRLPLVVFAPYALPVSCVSICRVLGMFRFPYS
jgi:hypothetical protein